MMTEAKTHSENSKIIGSIVFFECTTYCAGILMLGFRSSSNKRFMRAGKVNFQVMFRQTVFRVYAVRCKLCWYRLKNN